MLFHLDTSDSEGSNEDGTQETGTTSDEHTGSVGDEQARSLLGCLMDDIEEEFEENTATAATGEDGRLSDEGSVYICNKSESVQD